MMLASRSGHKTGSRACLGKCPSRHVPKCNWATQMSFALQREQLVENELRMLGIRDEAVLRAMRIVPREEFVSEEMREFAYRNAPLPIGSGQTISQPLIVAHMA